MLNLIHFLMNIKMKLTSLTKSKNVFNSLDYYEVAPINKMKDFSLSEITACFIIPYRLSVNTYTGKR